MRFSSPLSMVLVTTWLCGADAWVPQKPSFGVNRGVVATSRTTLQGRRRHGRRHEHGSSSKHAEENEQQESDPELLPDGSGDSTGFHFAKIMEGSSPEDVIKEEEVGVSNNSERKGNPKNEPFSKALQQTQISETDKERALPEPVPVPEDDLPLGTQSALPEPTLTEAEKATALPEPMKVEKIDVRASTGEDTPVSLEIQANQLSEEEKASALPEPNQVVVDPAIANSQVENEFDPVSPELQASKLTEDEKASALPEPLPPQAIDAPETIDDEKTPISADLQAIPFTEEDKASALPEPIATVVDPTIANARVENEFEPVSTELQATHIKEEDKASALPEPISTVVDPAIANARVENEFEPVSADLQATHISEEDKASALPEPISTVVDEAIAHQSVEDHNDKDPFSKDLLDTKLTPEEMEAAEEVKAGGGSQGGLQVPPGGPF